MILCYEPGDEWMQQPSFTAWLTFKCSQNARARSCVRIVKHESIIVQHSVCGFRGFKDNELKEETTRVEFQKLL